MPAKHTIDVLSKLIITTWIGNVTEVEFVESLESYQKNIRINSEYCNFNEVVNLTEVTDIKLSAASLKKISIIASRTDNKTINTKLALIVSSNLAYGLCMIYVAYRSLSKKSTKTVHIFKEEAKALKWAKKNTC